MERKQFIENIGDKKQVVFNGSNYLPVGYSLEMINNKWLHSAKLKDLRAANSIMIVDLERVESI